MKVCSLKQHAELSSQDKDERGLLFSSFHVSTSTLLMTYQLIFVWCRLPPCKKTELAKSFVSNLCLHVCVICLDDSKNARVGKLVV